VKIIHREELFREIYQRDQGRCWLCGQPAPYGKLERSRGIGVPPYVASLDHVVERRNGGLRKTDNLRVAHRFCNSVRQAYPNPTVHPNYASQVLARLRQLGLIVQERAAL
jgi:5-methylcytosine-specific restriction endonuclease McrA